MTVLAILPGGRRPEGRPSNAALQMEARSLRHALATITEQRDDMEMEATAQASERRAFVSDVLALARRGQVLLANGYRPAQPLHDLETAALREQRRVGPDGRAA